MNWVNLNILQQLAQHTSAELVKELVTIFEVEISKHIEVLESCIEKVASDSTLFNEVNKTAHTMKSVYANLGIQRMREICIDLESASRNGDVGACVQLVQQISSNHSEVLQDLKTQSLSLK